NPGLYRERPWCFVSDVNTKWEYCDIPFCQDLGSSSLIPLYNINKLHFCYHPPECKLTWHGTEYVGKLNVTMWGFPCLPWLMRMNEDGGRILHDELDGGHAFCRNDVFSAAPLECKTDVKGVSYIGTKNVTRKGHKCAAWIIGLMDQEEYVYSDYMENDMNSNFQKRLKDDLYPTHNFCRNWNDDEEGPWCYKRDEKGRDYCDIPICTENVSEN
ncbi:unnamed protein product, partial [Darwinula stevensoni]